VFYLSLAVAGLARLCVLLAGPLIVAGGRNGRT
jgi:hypothetical protein